MADRVTEQAQPAGLMSAGSAARPAWVVVEQDVAFRVGHEAEDAPGWVADSGDIEGGPVRVRGESTRRAPVRFDVAKGELALFAQRLQGFGVAGNEAAFSVCDRELEAFAGLQPR